LKKATFFNMYRRLSPTKRARTLISIDTKDGKNNLFTTPFSWNDAYREVYKGSVIGKRILEELK